MKRTELISASPGKTLSIAAQFVRSLPADALVFLDGPLGAGKTVFVRGMARALGRDPGAVRSPSFLLIHDYGGLLHIDCYRLQEAGLDVLLEAGILDTLDQPGIKAVEWTPPALKKIHPEGLCVGIDFTGDGKRRIVLPH